MYDIVYEIVVYEIRRDSASSFILSLSLSFKSLISHLLVTQVYNIKLTI